MTEDVRETAVSAEEPEKTFTQSQIDSIIGDLISKERKKYPDYAEVKEKASKYDQLKETSKAELEKITSRADELQKQYDEMTRENQSRQLREKIALETGIPASLLKGDSEEDLRIQADTLLEYAKPGRPVYPKVRDAGEAITPRASRQDILSIKNNKDRLKAIKENIELFRK